MLGLNPLFQDFVSGPKNGRGTHFFCKVCKRDVAMKAHGSGEFGRHFYSPGHWNRDVTYRVHMRLPIYNRLMEPMTLSAAQLAGFRSRPFEDLGEGFPFPEDLVPKRARIESKVPYMTLVASLCDFLRSGGDFNLVRRLWGYFRATLGERQPDFSFEWSRSETVVSIVVGMDRCVI